jgi:hypothetical protein
MAGKDDAVVRTLRRCRSQAPLPERTERAVCPICLGARSVRRRSKVMLSARAPELVGGSYALLSLSMPCPACGGAGTLEAKAEP